ncbi:MarR family winged helix-turn-helix transcriptional regulator [Alkalicoccus daliensis]|uniref:DNA-binding transcriptional regulator, MarR family n=1 Tax=Alkalicoccus daliensis TaxID=745820 RepID=A0A1H0CHI2_9BACI|nr:MarR family transcriptional regulator [Alkalicoccus daliensis]SDN57241.1 DNA-binding transcriptional regulator, MarR family [Alkalicoccus daliensis]
MDKERLQELIDQYANVYLFATKKIDRVLVDQAMPISLEQFGILRVLKKEGAISAKRVAQETDVHKSAVTSKVARLEERGFVQRTSGHADRRSILIELTAAGEAALEEGKKAMTDFIEPYFSRLDEEELEVFLSVYHKLNQMLHEEEF